jgi:hypothetical protein
MILFRAALFLTRPHRGGLWLALATSVLCAAWAYHAVDELDERPNARRDSKRLLEIAASLESTDRDGAIAAYEEIIRLYPETAASAEAARNIQAMHGRSARI